MRLLEFRARLVADVVTGKLDVRSVAAGVPNELEIIPLDEPTGEDADEDIRATDDEEVTA